MRNKKNKKNNITYYARILIVVGLTFLIYGAILDLNNEKRLYNPVTDVTEKEEGTVNISTIDNTEVVPGNKTKTTTNSADTIKNNSTNNTNQNTQTESQTTTEQPAQNNTPTQQTTPAQHYTPKPQQEQQPYVPTLDETNNNLRNSIQNTYGVTIKYGSETSGYTVAGISTTPINNATTVNASLTRLNAALSLYPRGMFSEIKNGGIPLTIMLINNYSENSVTGVTDSSYSYAVISIAVAYSFEESFYHESYHYMERYMFKKGANFTTWNSLNPQGFSYGNINNGLSYASTYSQDAPFVNAYAMTSAEEDRASTFEYMMAGSKASCLNYGTPVWKKSTVIKNMIETVYNTANPNTTEYWERYL